MLNKILAFYGKLFTLGSRPGDSRDERIHKAVLNLLSWTMIFGAPWDGFVALSAGDVTAGATLLVYVGLTIAGYVYFISSGKRVLFQRSQFVLILALTAMVNITGGGIEASHGMILWAGMVPLGALLLTSRREASLWFSLYFLLTLTLLLLDPVISRGAPVRLEGKEFYYEAGILLGFTPMVIILVHYFVTRLERARKELAEKNALLEVEQAKSERLLLNVLPASIAARLKEEHRTIADAFDEVTVLFADIVGFTKLSARTEPGPLVGMLDRVFTSFDGLVEKYGVEKIKTIGDAYMAAAGLPEKRDDHAVIMAEMALDLRERLKNLNEETGTDLDVRIGLHTGPVIAGVLGSQKFQYDLWGDTVNTASRMESHGEAGKIQVTETAYLVLKDRYRFEDRGVIDVKGKGPMRTYFLLDRQED
ncbi:MAG: adenylate/guanylate cyclase domain-containing protein [Planctomycetota bacterium]|jgi:guanylate cyclase